MEKISFEIPRNIRRIMKLISSYKYNSYIVGGAIRNTLLNIPPHDYDLVTDASLEELKYIFKNFNIVNNNSLKHNTLTINLEDSNIEISSFPEGLTNFIEDLKHRDFTINSIAYDGINTIYSKTSFKDLENKIIRCNGNPKERFAEDPLRILRAIRFYSILDFKIEKETEQAIFELKDTLNFVSKERIREEFNKILLSDNAFTTLNKYKEIFAVFIPELIETFDFEQKNKYHIHNVYEHNLYVMKNVKKDLTTRLSAFFHDIGKPATVSKEIVDGNEVFHFYGHSLKSKTIAKEILKRLKYPNSIIENVCFLIQYHDFHLKNSKKNLKKLLNLMEEKHEILFPKFIDLVKSDRLDHINLKPDNYNNYEMDLLTLYEEIKNEKECFSIKDLNINGKDLINLGLPKGPKIGLILNILLNKVINEIIPNEKESLIQETLKNFDKF